MGRDAAPIGVTAHGDAGERVAIDAAEGVLTLSRPGQRSRCRGSAGDRTQYANRSDLAVSGGGVSSTASQEAKPAFHAALSFGRSPYSFWSHAAKACLSAGCARTRRATAVRRPSHRAHRGESQRPTIPWPRFADVALRRCGPRVRSASPSCLAPAALGQQRQRAQTRIGGAQPVVTATGGDDGIDAEVREQGRIAAKVVFDRPGALGDKGERVRGDAGAHGNSTSVVGGAPQHEFGEGCLQAIDGEDFDRDVCGDQVDKLESSHDRPRRSRRR